MNKTIFEQVGDYILPNLKLQPEEERPIGIWGQRRLRYLKEHHKIIYYNMLTSGKLQLHLADIEEQAQELFLRLVKEYAERQGVTEQFKANDQMKWIRKMNNVRNRVTEVVSKEIIYT